MYGKDPETFFNEASVLFDDLSDCDIRIGGGDLNARTREIEDFISDIDGNIIPARECNILQKQYTSVFSSPQLGDVRSNGSVSSEPSKSLSIV